MLEDLSDLREPLFAARLLREQILVSPVPPAARDSLEATILARNGDGRGGRDGIVRACARPMRGAVRREDLIALPHPVPGALRRGPGAPFQGRAAPSPANVPALFEELLETVNSPVAMETWPGPVRAAALHFLLRLVQPLEPEESAPLAEASLLAGDGFDGRRMLLPAADAPELPVGPDVRPNVRPNVECFVRDRVHALVDALAATEEMLRAAAAKAVLRDAVQGRARVAAPGLNARQRALLVWMTGDEARPLAFEDYVRIHAGRAAPSLRSLQRDWKGLREAGWIAETDRGFEVRLAHVEWGGPGSAPPCVP